jgi:uncharacterized protein DUF4270
MNLLDKNLRSVIFGMLILFISCEDPSEIGLELTPDDQIGVFFKDFPINTTTTLLDSVDTRIRGARGFVGGYQDAQFGKIKTRINHQFIPEFSLLVNPDNAPNGVIPDDVEYVSIKLQIIAPYYKALTFEDEQIIRVYRIHEDLDEDRRYINKDTVTVIDPMTMQPDLIGEHSFSFIPIEDSISQLEITIDLDDEFGMELFEEAQQSVDTLNDTYGTFENFKEVFKGISIVPGDNNNIIFGMAVSNIELKMDLTYKKDTVETTVNYFFFGGAFDNVVGFNTIEADRTGTPLEALKLLEDLPNDNGMAYMQAGTGVIIRLDFDSMTTFFDSIDLVQLNRVEIVMEDVVQNMGEDDQFNAPSSLFYYYSDSTNQFLVDLDSTTNYVRRVENGIPVPSIFGEIFAPNPRFMEAVFDEEENYNTIGTLNFQVIIDGRVNDFDFLVLPTGYNTSFSQFAVKKEDIRLRVYYTTFKE